MNDKEIALELAKIVIARSNLTTHIEANDDDFSEPRFREVAKIDIAKEAADIYNAIYDRITKS